ncbi:MAG TPA: carboxypeptidase-like regulatory domain-containing protein [Acidimicrobiales bacterium]|nr:carboxypeptidase-like regulatory domain-containing protein [Acidimicrobiales bacterium]
MSLRSRVRWTSVLLPMLLLAASLSTVVVLAPIDVAPAGAESLPPYPGISYPGGAFNSRCAQMSLSSGPNVVHVGQLLTASAGPATDGCGGPARNVHWAWGLSAVGPVVSGCGANGSSCVVRAEYPSSDWVQVCIDGTSPFGSWSSCGMVYVLDHGWEVSGTVTIAGSGDPAEGVTVDAKCPSGGSTTTDKNGQYNFILDRGQCTIAPEAPAGETATPDNRVVNVGGEDIEGVDFELSGILYFKVEKGLSVNTKSPEGNDLIKAGTSFSEQVTLKDLSGSKTVVVAPIYPELSGNADGGSLQAVGGVIQKQLSSMSAAAPSPIVVLRPGEEQVFDSVIATVASRTFGTNDGGQKVSGGTRAYVQFRAPRAFVLKGDDDLEPINPDAIEVAKGSTDKITVSIDDSAPDQTPYNGYLATYDISKGALQGIYHLTYGLVHGIFYDLPVLLAKGVMAVPTGLINYLDLEAQLWEEAKDDPAEMALLDNAVTNNLLLIYKQAPFLLKKVQDLKASVDAAVSQHFNTLEQDWYNGDWESAATTWADDSTNFGGNAALLFVDPEVVTGAIADATIARVPGMVTALEAADASEYAEGTKLVDSTIGTGEDADTLSRAVRAMADLKPGMVLDLSDAANIFGISSQNLSDLIAFCKENHVVVTLRSRASEAIQLLEEGLAVEKPAAIKLKTVSDLDIEWLGYPSDVTIDGQTVSSVGQVLIKEPVFLSSTCAAACALQKLQSDMLSLGVEKGSPEWYQVQDRWVQRFGEWVNDGSGYVRNLDNAAKEKELTLDWHWQENHIDPEEPYVKEPQTVGFQMADGPRGTKIPQICTDWNAVRMVCSGTWKSITGDVDLVSITAADGSPLSDPEYVDMLQSLGEPLESETNVGTGSVKPQHPTTSTWYLDVNDSTGEFLFDPNNPDFADKAKYMQAGKCCLLQVGPNGVPRAVMLDLKGSYFNNKNDFFLNYVGRELVPAP